MIPLLLLAAGLSVGFVVGSLFEGCRHGGSLDLRICATKGHDPEITGFGVVSCSRCDTRLMACVA